MEAAARSALQEAMLNELAERGYEACELASAARAAGLSIEQARAQFAEEDECLFAAYDALTERLVGLAGRACAGGGEWPERTRRGLGALLEAIRARPQLAAAVTRGFPAIRPSAQARYTELLAKLAPLVAEGRQYSGVDEELPAEVELLAVGAAESLIFSEIDAGRAEELPGKMPEILFSILVPFIGPERAADEMREAAAAL